MRTENARVYMYELSLFPCLKGLCGRREPATKGNEQLTCGNARLPSCEGGEDGKCNKEESRKYNQTLCSHLPLSL